MSDEFSDDLSDPTPSPPPARSSSKAVNARKGGAGLSSGRGKASANSKPFLPAHRKSNSAVSVSGAAHSRTHSQANSVTVSIQSGSHTRVAAVSKRHSRSESKSSGSQSGSDLSSPPSEEEKEPTRPDDDEDEDEDDGEDDEEDEAGDHEKTVAISGSAGRAGRNMSQRSTRRNSSTRGRGTRSSRGVIPAPMWEWAKKKPHKKPKASQSEDEDDEDVENAGDAIGQSPADPNIDKSLELIGRLDSQDADDAPYAEDDAQEDKAERSATDHGMGNDETIKSIVEDEIDSHQSHNADDDDHMDDRELDVNVPSVKVEPPPSTVFSPKALPTTPLDIEDADNQDLLNGEDDVEGDADMELQAADRQDALDALALLELKLALVRQRLFQDKMDELGREEDMIRNGTHPELLHTIAELDKRRERRIQLAENKRKRDIDLAAKLRSHEEDGIWSWWGVQKDMLQATMITEASRKRRKIERDRRALLDPIRRTLETFPPEPPKALRTPNPIPSLKEVVSAALRHPYARLPHSFISERGSIHSMLNGGNRGSIAHMTALKMPQGQAASSMPVMSQLTEAEVHDDLEILLGYRRPYEEVEIPPHDAHHPNVALLSGTGLDINNLSSVHVPTGRSTSEHSRTPHDNSRRDAQSFSDQGNLHNRSVSGLNATFSANNMNGRDRPSDQERAPNSNRSQPPGHSHASVSGHSYHPHVRPVNQASNQSPGLGLQGLHRTSEITSAPLAIQNLPLPPAPSTLPHSSANKLLQTGSGLSPRTNASSTHSQHPSLPWESGKREREKDHDGHTGRDRHTVASSRSSVAPTHSYSTPAGPTPSHGGRTHPHSVSHHYHTGHSHHVPQHVGNRPHTHTVQVHHHSQSHSHHPSTSHLHVIHNHAPMASPAESPKSSASYRHEVTMRPGYQVEKSNRAEATPGTWKGTSYEESEGPRPRSSYSNGPERDNDRDFHRTLTSGSNSSLPHLTHPLERSSMTSSFHTSSQGVPSREAWNERDHGDRDRVQMRDKELHRERGHSGASHPSSNLYNNSDRQSSSAQPPTSRYQHQAAPRSSGASPLPLLPPVPNTSHRYTNPIAGARQLPTETPDPFSNNGPFSPSEAPDHLQPAPLAHPGFNPWSAPPRTTTRPSTVGSPTLVPPLGQILGAKPDSSIPSSTVPNPLASQRASTSPILARPQQSISPTPRPPLSPAPRPPSSSSIHAILQAPLREAVQDSHSSGSILHSSSKRASNDSISMEIDPINSTAPGQFTLNSSSK
ncbi:hypothetical protein FRC17_009989 [Serendipita sp. 399]|nr:hypothetical protein FRC17_009989 [Serendipita sp. 399]